MMEKKAQGLSINAIILIILGVAVLVILVLGFTKGWDQFAFWVPSTNIDTIVKSCDMACSSQAGYDYCSLKRELKTQGGKFQNVTCYVLAYDTTFTTYGITKCSSVSCKDTVPCTEDNQPWGYIDPKGVRTAVSILGADGKPLASLSPNYCKDSTVTP